MKKNLVIFILIAFIMIIGAFFIFIYEKSTSPPTGMPDWIVKPKGNYSGLYCGASPTLLEQEALSLE